MFLQPMLLIEELEQFPYSTCKLAGKAMPSEIWTGFLRGIEALAKDAPLSYEQLQRSITTIRTCNGHAGWLGPHGIPRYQTIACAVQEPTNWAALNAEDRESLDDYIECVLKRASAKINAHGHEEQSTLVQVSSPSLGIEVAVPKAIAESLSADIDKALGKIENVQITQQLEHYIKADLARLVTSGSPYDSRCTICHQPYEAAQLRRCSKCKVPTYCGVECQRIDWKETHKQKCSEFAEFIAIKVPATLAEVLKKHRPETLKMLGEADRS